MKKKIIFIITRLDKGGSAENVIDICSRLSSEKYEITLIHGKGSRHLNINYKVFYIPELVRAISPLKDITAFWKIYHLLKKIKPDIVHTHSSKAGFLGRWATFILRTMNGVYFAESGKLRTIKTIHTPHGHIFYGYFGGLKSWVFILLERLTSKITDKFIALTDGEKNESVAFGVGKPQQWTVIHAGVDSSSEFRIQNLELRRELNISENAIVIGTVARLDPIKGVKYLVDAIPLVTQSLNLLISQSLVFLIVGDGSERKNLELRSKNLELNNRVIFTGMRDDVLDLISIMDIYIQPSLNEGMGKTIIYAMMLGKPIIATDVQGIPSLINPVRSDTLCYDTYSKIKNEERGILVPPKNPQTLANAIKELLQNKELSQKISVNAKKWVNETVDGFQRFSIERQLYLLMHLYENI